MGAFLKKLVKNFELYLSGLILYVLIAISTSSVLSRYILPTSLVWSEELSRYLFMWISMLSCSYAIASNGHLAVTMVPDLFLKKYPKARMLLRIVTNIGFIVFLFVLAQTGMERIITTTELSAALRIPMKLVYFALPLGCGLSIIRLVLDIIKWVRQKGEVETEINTTQL